MKNNNLFYVPETKEVYAKLIGSYVIYPDNYKFESLLGEASAISPFTAKDDI